MNNNMISQFQQFMQNLPTMINRMGIPQQYAKDPNGMIQYLMNSGKISQQQYNQAKSLERQIGPQFRQMFNTSNTKPTQNLR